MERQNDVNSSKVVKLFDERAQLLTGINAVMSSSDDPITTHKNKFRDYITRMALIRFLNPKNKDVVLDFGCGVGRLTKAISPYVKCIDAIDISSAMVEKAIQLNPIPNGSYHVLNNSFEFQKENYTKIFTCWVCQHMDEPQLEKMIQQFYQSLQKNGKVIILEQISTDDKMQENVLLQRTSSFYITLFEKGGFTHTEQRKIMRYPSYAMNLWIKFVAFTRFPRLFLWLENATINRKPEHTEYYSEVFIFEKK